MNDKKRCPVCNKVLYKKHEGLVCKNWKCDLFFKLGRGWCLIGEKKTIEEQIVNDLWNQDSRRRLEKQWIELKSFILRRDNYQCKFCDYNLSKDFNRKIGLDVHHIIPASENSALYLDDENLITVCRKCHAKLHSADKHKFLHTSKEQLIATPSDSASQVVNDGLNISLKESSEEDSQISSNDETSLNNNIKLNSQVLLQVGRLD